jgi:hypothetical protein
VEREEGAAVRRTLGPRGASFGRSRSRRADASSTRVERRLTWLGGLPSCVQRLSTSFVTPASREERRPSTSVAPASCVERETLAFDAPSTDYVRRSESLGRPGRHDDCPSTRLVESAGRVDRGAAAVAGPTSQVKRQPRADDALSLRRDRRRTALVGPAPREERATRNGDAPPARVVRRRAVIAEATSHDEHQRTDLLVPTGWAERAKVRLPLCPESEIRKRICDSGHYLRRFVGLTPNE